MYSETIRGSVYKPKQQIVEELHISKSTVVYARMKEIERSGYKLQLLQRLEV